MAMLSIQEAFDLGVRHHQAGQLPQAESLYRQVLTRQPMHSRALHYLGLIAHQAGRNDIAVELFRQAVAVQSNYAQAFSDLGKVLKDMGRLDEAVAACSQAIALEPDYPEAHINLGNALLEKGESDQAIAAYRKALALKPDRAEAHKNLGYALMHKEQLDQAVASYRQAISLKPDYAEAHSDLGNILGEKGQRDEAIAAYRQAISLDPQFAEAHWNLALALLLRGDFLSGWQEYEWRWKLKKFSSPLREFPQARWDGSDLNNRTLFLYSEQGFGDAIQFIRYLPMVAQRGRKVIVECPMGLKRLLQTNSRGWQITANGEAAPGFDVHYPLMSLPSMFGTTLQSIPSPIPFLRADAESARKWQIRLDTVSTGLKVGLAWAGNPDFKGDRFRSPRQLSLLAPLAQVKNVQFVSLQKGDAAQQTKSPPAGMELIDWTDELHDFADTAALIENLDLVISSDTAVAHLAGAMGKSVWVLLPLAPDWRWLLQREDSPWYPTMRLFRQPSIGDWKSVVEEAKMALPGFAGCHR